MATAVVLIVGDEILEGHTQDTNSQFLAGRLRGRGVALRGIVTVGDDVDGIARALGRLLGDAPDFIFVCGGIGPTPDDRTYEAVAMAVGRPLVLEPADEAWMRSRVARTGYGADLLEDPINREGMLRMIRRPEGSAVVENPVGAALGSAIAHGPTMVFVLPGVPRELRAMMTDVLEPRFLGGQKNNRVTLELEFRGEEARTYGLLRELEATHPDVKLGSYPQDERGRILLRLQGPPAQVETVARRLEAQIHAQRRPPAH